jgi:hypothetical protein
MNLSMHNPRIDRAPDPGQQAGNILRAWVRNDEPALRQELSNALALCASHDCSGLDEEHLDLLKAIVVWLQQPRLNPEVAAPAVRLCIDLLSHLSLHCSGTAAVPAPDWTSKATELPV